MQGCYRDRRIAPRPTRTGDTEFAVAAIPRPEAESPISLRSSEQLTRKRRILRSRRAASEAEQSRRRQSAETNVQTHDPGTLQAIVRGQRGYRSGACLRQLGSQ